jgi:hypothetical protein
MQPGLDPSDNVILKVCCELEIERGERGAELDPERVLEKVEREGVGREQAVESMELLNDEGFIEATYTNSTMPYLVTVTDAGFDVYGHAYIPDYDSVIESVGHRIVDHNERDSVEIADALNARLVTVEHVLGLFEAREFIESSNETGPSLEINRVSPRLGRWLQAYDLDKPPITPDEFSHITQVGETPVEIQESLERFKEDHPDSARTAFMLMQFGQTRAHEEIAAAIKEGLAVHGIIGVRADDRQYHDDLFPNVLTYMHGCGLGIAVFERIEAERFNPNVALEVGYMFAMRKPVCLLKDRTLDTLHADLVGKLFRQFDTQNPGETIPPVVSKWLSDKGLPRR